jgi:hypothetical protein
MVRRGGQMVLLAGLAVLAIGCSRSEFVEVTGSVSWQGKPVEIGEIIFAPRNKSVAPVAGRIRGGEYKLLAKPGKVRVEIQAVRKTGKRDPKEGFEITELYIPRRYNEESELEAEVTADGDNRFEFALTE